MKPVEYLCLAILLQVANLMKGSPFVALAVWLFVAMWAVGSFRAFRAEQQGRQAK